MQSQIGGLEAKSPGLQFLRTKQWARIQGEGSGLRVSGISISQAPFLCRVAPI